MPLAVIARGSALSVAVALCVAAAGCTGDAGEGVDDGNLTPSVDGGASRLPDDWVDSGTDAPEEAEPNVDAGVSRTPGSDLLTVEGTGFGTKAAGPPVLWDDFESGAPGTQVENQDAVHGTWQTGAGSPNPVYSTAVAREGSQSCLHPFTGATYNSSLSLNLPVTKAYLDYWVYVDPLDPSYPEGLSRNWKPFRLYGDDDRLQAGFAFLNGDTATIAYFFQTGVTDTNEWFAAGWSRQEWIHIQYWLELNDPGMANGSYKAMWNGHSAGESNLELRTGSASMNQLRIGHYWATDPVPGWDYTNPGANIYNDSIYFDTSWARVEIGDNPDYDACTHREIQVVTEWSDTRVRFELQRGTLAPGSYWVFVIDEENAVRAAEPIHL